MLLILTMLLMVVVKNHVRNGSHVIVFVRESVIQVLKFTGLFAQNHVLTDALLVYIDVNFSALMFVAFVRKK